MDKCRFALNVDISRNRLYLGEHTVLTGVFLVEASKGVSYHLLRVRPLKPFPKEGEKHGEVDRSGRVVHHEVQVVVGNVLGSE